MLRVLIPTRARAQAIYADRPAHMPRREWGLFRSPLYWLVVACIGMIAGGEAAFSSLMPVYFVKTKAMSAEAASLLLTVHLLGLVAGRFASAYLGGRLSNDRLGSRAQVLHTGHNLCRTVRQELDDSIGRRPAAAAPDLAGHSPPTYRGTALHRAGGRIGLVPAKTLGSYLVSFTQPLDRVRDTT